MMPLEALEKLVQTDLAIIETALQTQFSQLSPILVQEIHTALCSLRLGRHRTFFIVAIAKIFPIQEHLYRQLSVLIELLHSAAFLHTLALDGPSRHSEEAEGSLAISTEEAILVGDYLATHTFLLLAQFNNTQLAQIFSKAYKKMIEGLMLQRMLRSLSAIEEADCHTIAYCKSALLFELAAQSLAKLCSHISPAQEVALQQYAKHLGMTMQFMEDLSEYTLPAIKPPHQVGESLRIGRMTLPLFYTIRRSTPTEIALIRSTFRDPEKAGPALRPIHSAMLACGALEQTKTAIREEMRLALEALKALPASHFCQALAMLVQLAGQPHAL